MPNEVISQITLPDGTTYDLVDATTTLTSTYDSTTDTVTLMVGSLTVADNNEY